MTVVTSSQVAGKRIVRSLGLVRGNTIRARHVGKDILAGFRNILIHEYARVDIAKVHDILANHLDDFDAFRKQIVAHYSL